VLVTGHTGFTGGWLCAWLHSLGAEVSALALPPATQPAFYDLTKLGQRIRGTVGDIRSVADLAKVFTQTDPQIVFHLAAQALVREGYSDPRSTFDVNVMGTVNVLEQVRAVAPEALVVMTSDKVYGSAGHPSGHREGDRVWATDPYGASKACCELAIDAYAQSFFQPLGIGSASIRAGNVIGGGDWGADRLVPDAVRAFSAGEPLVLRRPDAVRPWQHVLDAVTGLLRVAAAAAARGGPIGAWNVGPVPGSPVTAGSLARMVAAEWGDEARIRVDAREEFPETSWLAIDSGRARSELSLRPPWTIERAIAETVSWYKHGLADGDPWAFTQAQIAAYTADCRKGVLAKAAG
jgi:CDP-glucose 4,6-dehydratase